MYFLFRGVPVLALGLVSVSWAFAQNSAETDQGQPLPSAPQPRVQVAMLDARAEWAGDSSSLDNQPGDGSVNRQVEPPKSQHDIANEQLKEEEQQRVVGMLPTFNVSYRTNAVSLTPGQKMSLALHSVFDPAAFVVPWLEAGYKEGLDSDPGFGWGVEGLSKRAGAIYLDNLNGTIIGNGIFPIIFRQDPRYFRLGHGTVTHRILYSVATNFICLHDNTHKWEINYSNILGNIAGGAISNLYYPASSGTGVGQTFSDGLLVTAVGGIGSVFEEFWPDLSRKFLHKDPTHGLDAQAKAEDEAERKARKEAKKAEAGQ